VHWHSADHLNRTQRPAAGAAADEPEDYSALYGNKYRLHVTTVHSTAFQPFSTTGTDAVTRTWCAVHSATQ
jgi:hypothetical protein